MARMLKGGPAYNQFKWTASGAVTLDRIYAPTTGANGFGVIAVTSVASGATAHGYVAGVVVGHPATTGDGAATAGQLAYLNSAGEVTPTSTSNTPIGRFEAAKADGADTADVRVIPR